MTEMATDAEIDGLRQRCSLETKQLIARIDHEVAERKRLEQMLEGERGANDTLAEHREKAHATIERLEAENAELRRKTLLDAAAECRAEHDSVTEPPPDGEGPYEKDLYIPGYQDGCDNCEYRLTKLAERQGGA